MKSFLLFPSIIEGKRYTSYGLWASSVRNRRHGTIAANPRELFYLYHFLKWAKTSGSIFPVNLMKGENDPTSQLNILYTVIWITTKTLSKLHLVNYFCEVIFKLCSLHRKNDQTTVLFELMYVLGEVFQFWQEFQNSLLEDIINYLSVYVINRL